MTTPSLTAFRALSFDCYGTLIDWETGIYNALAPLLSLVPPSHPYNRSRKTVIAQFSKLQTALEHDHPGMTYTKVLSTAYAQLASSLDLPLPAVSEAEAFGQTAGTWPAFPDTVAGLRALSEHYKLFILSNVDGPSIAATRIGPLAGVPFSGIYTAQDVGNYKPDHANFRYLFSHLKGDFGIEQNELLHVAKSLPVDHVPAKELDLVSAWISREEGSGMGGGLGDFEGKVAFTWRFGSIGEMAECVEKAFTETQGGQV